MLGTGDVFCDLLKVAGDIQQQMDEEYRQRGKSDRWFELREKSEQEPQRLSEGPKIATEVSDLSVGEEVRINRGGGSFLRGPIQEIHPDGVVVRGKKHPFSAVQTVDEVEAVKDRNIRGLREEEREAARLAEADALRGGGHTPKKPSQSPLDFSGSFLTAILGLKVDVRLYWQDHYDALAQEWARENNVPLTGIQPMQFGNRGGTTPQWGICGRVAIAVPANQASLNVILRELSAGGTEPQIVDGNIVINGYRAAAGMAKAGFPAHS
jgi:hypothetical protein